MSFKHILTTFSWYLTVFVIGICLFLNKPQNRINKIHSSKQKFDSHSDPVYFVHISDVHITRFNPSSETKLKTTFSFANKCHSETIVNTGDLTDNWHRHSFWKEAGQNIDDHEYYKEVVSEEASKVKLFLDQSGNHDIFGVYSYDSPNNLIIHTSNYYSKQKNLSYENFTVSTHVSDDGIVFVIVNPVYFPAPKALIDTFTNPPIELIDRVEEALINANGKGHIVLMNHHPAYQWFDTKSSYGHTFREMNQIYNISIAISGHSHPEEAVPVHHNENLEVIGSDVVKHNQLGVVSFDNGNVVYTRFNIDDEPKAIITNPVPINILTKHDIFNDNNVDIRALVFSNNTEDIHVYEDENELGKMEYVRTLRDGVQLYHLNHNFCNGEHMIRFDGFYCNNLKFFVGDELPPFNEYTHNDYNIFFAPKTLVIIIMVYLSIILFPIPFESYISQLSKYAQKKLVWLYKEGMSVKEFFTSFLFGFLTIRWRILAAPRGIRYILFAGIFAPFLLPIDIQSIEGHYGFVTTYGYYNSGISRRSQYGNIFRLMYLWLIEVPLVLLVSMFYNYCQFQKIFCIEIFLVVFGYIACFLFSALTITQTTNIWYAITGPLLILWPIVMLICITCWRVFLTKEKNAMMLIDC